MRRITQKRKTKTSSLREGYFNRWVKMSWVPTKMMFTSIYTFSFYINKMNNLWMNEKRQTPASNKYNMIFKIFHRALSHNSKFWHLSVAFTLNKRRKHFNDKKYDHSLIEHLIDTLITWATVLLSFGFISFMFLVLSVHRAFPVEFFSHVIHFRFVFTVDWPFYLCV